MMAQMARLPEQAGKPIREETDEEQEDMEFRKKKGSGELYQGVKNYKQGGLYRGLIKNGKREGKGKMIFPKGHQQIQYEGDWLND